MAQTHSAPMPGENDSPSQGSKREQSSISFAYFDLDEAVKIAKGIHDVHGSSCQVDQLAAHLGESPTSSSFRGKVGAAKMFGLVTSSQGVVSLTTLGRQICDAQQERAARAEAFLTVPLYKAVYEQFKGVTLPPNQGLESAMATLGVASKQKERARQIFQRSAQEAGFFQFGTERLIAPPIKASTAPTAKPEAEHEIEEEEEQEAKEKPRHPLIEGLLRELPEPQSEWTTEDRKKWLEMASTIFNVIYKDSDDSRGSLRVTIEKSSAKP